jgi:hypothetical protein
MQERDSRTRLWLRPVLATSPLAWRQVGFPPERTEDFVLIVREAVSNACGLTAYEWRFNEPIDSGLAP